jgi:hypothetical protein
MVTQQFTDLLGRAMRARQVVCAADRQRRDRHDCAQPEERRPFTGITSASAISLAARAASHQFGLILEGVWDRRRFVVDRVCDGSSLVSYPACDIARRTLALPMKATEHTIARECQSFGARVERWFRDHHRGQFDLECGADWRGPGGLRHLVHRYHHVALCQYRGPWAERPLEPEISSELQMCPVCCHVAREPPAYRARYHPQSFDQNRLAPPG